MHQQRAVVVVVVGLQHVAQHPALGGLVEAGGVQRVRAAGGARLWPAAGQEEQQRVVRSVPRHVLQVDTATRGTEVGHQRRVVRVGQRERAGDVRAIGRAPAAAGVASLQEVQIGAVVQRGSGPAAGVAGVHVERGGDGVAEAPGDLVLATFDGGHPGSRVGAVGRPIEVPDDAIGAPVGVQGAVAPAAVVRVQQHEALPGHKVRLTVAEGFEGVAAGQIGDAPPPVDRPGPLRAADELRAAVGSMPGAEHPQVARVVDRQRGVLVGVQLRPGEHRARPLEPPGGMVEAADHVRRHRAVAVEAAVDEEGPVDARGGVHPPQRDRRVLLRIGRHRAAVLVAVVRLGPVAASIGDLVPDTGVARGRGCDIRRSGHDGGGNGHRGQATRDRASRNGGRRGHEETLDEATAAPSGAEVAESERWRSEGRVPPTADRPGLKRGDASSACPSRRPAARPRRARAPARRR